MRRRAGFVMGAALCVAALGGVMASCTATDEPATITTLAVGQRPTAIAADGTNVYWVDPKAGVVMQELAVGGPLVTLASNQYNPAAIAFNVTDVYWANQGESCAAYEGPCGGGAIVKVPIGGGAITTLANPEQPLSIALDGSFVYWITDSTTKGTVAKVPLSGGQPITLATGLDVDVIGTAGASNLTVQGGYLYWTTLNGNVSSTGANGSIYRLPTGGGNLSTLPSAPTNPGPIVSDSKRLYWLDQQGPEGDTQQVTVVTASLGGGTAKAMAISDGADGYGLALDSTHVYWTSYTGSTLLGGYVMSVPIGGGSVVTLALADTGGGGVAVDDTSVYWTGTTSVMKSTPKTADLTATAPGAGAGEEGGFEEGGFEEAGASPGAPVYGGSGCDPSSGTLSCDEGCTDVDNDTANCGACGQACPANAECSNALCACYSSYDFGYIVCNDACIDGSNDDENCGACGHACPTGSSCIDSRCTCDNNDAACDDSCIDIGTDPNNCGGCGRKCALPETCVNGSCGCADGGILCGTTCVLDKTDPNNCGACGKTCTAPETCANGSCACPSGGAVCGTACVDETSDPNNCGACGMTCTAPQTCVASLCSCATGETACGSACVNEMTDPNNCGACGMTCGDAAPYCAQGFCVPIPAPNCATGTLGVTDCLGGVESCCTSYEVPGGAYYRTYDPVIGDGGVVTGPDGGPAGEADPATVSGFQLDRLLVTVGRFRQFVNAWNGGTGYVPTPGSGLHTHLNGGKGLSFAAPDGGIQYEPGWAASDDDNVAPTNANLICGSEATWTQGVSDNDFLPINCVTWAEAYAFCIWDGGFLPTEAEWEFAAAGGSEQLEYPWGSSPPTVEYAINNCDYGPLDAGCTVQNVAPVGSTPLGDARWGQLDMAGEVWEWVLDWYAPYVTPWSDEVQLTPSTARVNRGGDFWNTLDPSPAALTASYRESWQPTTRDAGHGFRCARTP